MGADLAARIVDDEDRAGEFRAEAPSPPRAPKLRARLAAWRRASAGGCAAAARAGALLRSHARPAWERPAARAGTASRLAASRSAALMTPRAKTRSRTVSRAARAAAGKRSGRRASGDCGKATSKRRLGDRQALRLLAEIGKARRPHAFDIAAIRREREIKIEDAGLARPAVRSRSRAGFGRTCRQAIFPRAAAAAAPPASSGSSRPRRYGHGVPIAARRAPRLRTSTPGWRKNDGPHRR